MKIQISQSARTAPYIHATNAKFEIGKTYKFRGVSIGTFGDYEKILEHFRPANKPSRLSSFFLAADVHAAQFLTNNDRDSYYAVQPVGPTATVVLGWIQLLQLQVRSTANGKIKNVLAASTLTKLVEQLCDGYWSGKSPSAGLLKKLADNFEYSDDFDYKETLASSIKVLGLVTDGTTLGLEYRNENPY